MLVAELCWGPSIAIVEFECIIITELVDGGKITALKYPIPLFKCLFKVSFVFLILEFLNMRIAHSHILT
jgi:hypothetical protein